MAASPRLPGQRRGQCGDGAGKGRDGAGMGTLEGGGEAKGAVILHLPAEGADPVQELLKHVESGRKRQGDVVLPPGSGSSTSSSTSTSAGGRAGCWPPGRQPPGGCRLVPEGGRWKVSSCGSVQVGAELTGRNRRDIPRRSPSVVSGTATVAGQVNVP